MQNTCFIEKLKKRKKEKRNVVTKFIESSLLRIITMIIALKKPSYFSIKHFPLNEKEHIHVMVTLCTSSQQLTSQTLYPTLFSYVSSPFSPPADCHAHQSMSSQVHCIGSNSGSISAMFFLHEGFLHIWNFLIGLLWVQVSSL